MTLLVLASVVSAWILIILHEGLVACIQQSESLLRYCFGIVFTIASASTSASKLNRRGWFLVPRSGWHDTLGLVHKMCNNGHRVEKSRGETAGKEVRGIEVGVVNRKKEREVKKPRLSC